MQDLIYEFQENNKNFLVEKIKTDPSHYENGSVNIYIALKIFRDTICHIASYSNYPKKAKIYLLLID